ncbi:MAG: tRNA (adenosine(37)-N6)-threonylcarbamoyltransferase complex dimerization subunit type 1 TsaB [Bacteroidia bacterium]
MARLLLLETSAAVCSVALAAEGRVISRRAMTEPNRHAEFLTVYCEEVLHEAGIKIRDLDAVAVSSGPGSYTGLRIGVSAAKGICYATGIPLIAIPTLDVMADAMRQQVNASMYCPMIDARRMEVYATVYDQELRVLKATSPVVLTEYAFQDILEKHTVCFGGDGMPKAKEMLSHYSNAVFTEHGLQLAENMAMLAEHYFQNKNFEDVAYFEPFYLKTFQPGPKRSQA